MEQLRALTSATHHVLDRMRRRVDGVFVALHAAHLQVQGELARAGARGDGDPGLLVDLPELGFGRFLGGLLLRWMIETPAATAGLDALLLAPPPTVARDAFVGMPPLAWVERARLVVEAAHRVVDELVAGPGEVTAILEAFVAHGEASFAALDDAALHRRCSEAMWLRWLTAWLGAARSADELEHRLASQPRLIAAIARRHPALVDEMRGSDPLSLIR